MIVVKKSGKQNQGDIVMYNKKMKIKSNGHVFCAWVSFFTNGEVHKVTITNRQEKNMNLSQWCTIDEDLNPILMDNYKLLKEV